MSDALNALSAHHDYCFDVHHLALHCIAIPSKTAVSDWLTDCIRIIRTSLLVSEREGDTRTPRDRAAVIVDHQSHRHDSSATYLHTLCSGGARGGRLKLGGYDEVRDRANMDWIWGWKVAHYKRMTHSAIFESSKQPTELQLILVLYKGLMTRSP